MRGGRESDKGRREARAGRQRREEIAGEGTKGRTI